MKIGYWLASADQRFPVADNAIPYFTHLYYGFLQVNGGTGDVIIPRELEQDMKTFSEQVRNENKKAMVSIGGPKPNNDATAADPSIAISQMAGNRASRNRFIETTLALAEKYKFDGVELAWIYPKTMVDMTNLHNLFSEWKRAADLHNLSNGRKLLLSAAVYCYPSIPNAPNEEVRYTGELNTCIDIFNIIFYNYSPVTSYHSRFGRPIRPPHNYNTQDALQEWTNVGISLTKLVMGIPLYGGKWIMADDVNEVTDGAQAVEYKGRVAYRDIPDPESGTYDDVAWCTSKVERDANGNPFWYGYEDTQSVREKVLQANNRLGGYFLYAINHDADDLTLCRAADSMVP
ncbi:hypothetical protein CsatB_015850 [Cannabis sativa]